MKKIEAIIKPFKLSAVKEALHEINLSGMTVLDVKGFGRQRGKGITNDQQDYSDDFIAKIKIEIIVDDNIVEKAIEGLGSKEEDWLIPFFENFTKEGLCPADKTLEIFKNCGGKTYTWSKPILKEDDY